MVAKQDLGAGGDILETELPLAADDMTRHAAQIARGLVREAGECRAFRLRLEHAAQRSADKQRIIDRPRRGRELAYGDTEPGAAVHLLARLHQPAGLGQLAVNRYPRPVLRM